MASELGNMSLPAASNVTAPTAQQLVDGLLVTALGTTQAGNLLHAALGSMIGMGLVGIVSSQASSNVGYENSS